MNVIITVADAPLYAIAKIVRADWKKVNYAAEPYLAAMETLTNVDDLYYADDGRSVVLYFLANSNSWRGEAAKMVKAELKRRVR